MGLLHLDSHLVLIAQMPISLKLEAGTTVRTYQFMLMENFGCYCGGCFERSAKVKLVR